MSFFMLRRPPSKPPEPPYVVPQQYVDTNAEIVLVSEDGHRFAVHSFILKTHSKVFRDMFDTCLPPSSEQQAVTSSEIPIEATAVVLQALLDLMHTGHSALLDRWEVCHALFGLFERYDCDGLAPIVLLRLEGLVDKAPWEIFAFASHMDRLSLARKAICAFDHLPGYPRQRRDFVKTLPMCEARQVRLDYLLGLIQRIGDAGRDGRAIDWERIARGYIPAV